MGQINRLCLFTGLDDVLCARLAAAVRRKNIDVLQTPWNDETLDLVGETGFDVIAIGYPVPPAELGRFLSAVRAKKSASRRAGMVLIVAPGSFDSAQTLVGRGVNRIVSKDSPPERLIETVNDLLRVAPRVTIRASARICPQRAERGPHVALCQTVNLSSSGMLLRGWAHYPVGTRFDFQLHIAAESDPIRGEAFVARTTDLERERFDGFGARFVSFEGVDKDRLEEFLVESLDSAQLH